MGIKDGINWDCERKRRLIEVGYINVVPFVNIIANFAIEEMRD